MRPNLTTLIICSNTVYCYSNRPSHTLLCSSILLNADCSALLLFKIFVIEVAYFLSCSFYWFWITLIWSMEFATSFPRVCIYEVLKWSISAFIIRMHSCFICCLCMLIYLSRVSILLDIIPRRLSEWFFLVFSSIFLVSSRAWANVFVDDPLKGNEYILSDSFSLSSKIVLGPIRVSGELLGCYMLLVDLLSLMNDFVLFLVLFSLSITNGLILASFGTYFSI